MFKKGNKIGRKFQSGHKINLGRKRPPRSTEWLKNQSISQIGKHLSEETKRKIGLASIGNKYSLGHRHTVESKRKMSISRKGLNTWTKGRKLSLERKLKMSERWKKENNPRWKGGITLLRHQIRTCFKYRQWRSDVFTRDSFRCRDCGNKGYLESHHSPKTFSEIIDEYNIRTLEEALNCEELWNINNGITLCLKCHDKPKKI